MFQDHSNLYGALAVSWGVTREAVKSAFLAEDYAIDPSIEHVETTAVMIYRATRPVNRLPEAVNDGMEVTIIQTLKQTLTELEAEHILEVEAEFCRKVGAL